MELKWGGKNAPTPILTGTARNTGETPAKWFEVQQYIFTAPIEDRPERDHPKECLAEARKTMPRRWNALGGNLSDLTFYASGEESGETIRSVYRKADVTLHVCGVLRYETFYGELFETEFWFSRSHIPQWKGTDCWEPVEGGVKICSSEMAHPIGRAMCALESYKCINKT